MKEWKDLEIDYLPKDILTGDYEFEVLDVTSWQPSIYPDDPCNILRQIFENIIDYRYRYRKPEPKQPSHEEIMTLWWELDIDVWQKVFDYTDGEYGFLVTNSVSSMNRSWYTKDFFIGRESADIPAETDNDQ